MHFNNPVRVSSKSNKSTYTLSSHTSLSNLAIFTLWGEKEEAVEGVIDAE